MASKELTASQHVFIRQQLALIPIYVWVLYAWGVFFAHLPIGPFGTQTHVARDFVHFYAQGAIARQHDAQALYNIDAMAKVVERVVPVHVDVRFPPVYGPQVSLFFAPFAYIPYVPALILWLGFTIAGYFGCVFLVWRSCPSLARRRWMTAVFALGAAGLHFTLSFGQASVIGLACFTAIWLMLRAGRPFAAGLAVGALAYKPQLGVVAAFVFVFAQEWRVVAGAVVVVVAQIAAGWAFWGTSAFTAYADALRKLPGVIDAMEPDKALMHSWRSLFLHAGLSSFASLTLSLVMSVATIAIAIACWRARGSLAPRYIVLVLATLLVDPHIYAYDLLVLAPTLMVAWDWANRQGDMPVAELRPERIRGRGFRFSNGGAAAGLAMFVYLAPLLTIALPAVPIQWSVVSFLLLGTAAASSSLRPESSRADSPR